MALTTLEDLIFFDAIGMIDLNGINTSSDMAQHLNQMPPEAVKALEIQIANSVSQEMGVNTYTTEFDFWGLGFYGNDPINVQTVGPATDILETTYEEVTTNVSTNTTPTTIPALPAHTTPCTTCKDGELMQAVQKHKKVVGLVVVLGIIVAAYSLGKA